MFSSAWQSLVAFASMRTRVMLLVTLGAMPLAGLLVAGAIEVRRDVVQASGQQVLELARLGAEQQDSIVREAKTLLRVLSRLAASAWSRKTIVTGCSRRSSRTTRRSHRWR